MREGRGGRRYGGFWNGPLLFAKENCMQQDDEQKTAANFKQLLILKNF